MSLPTDAKQRKGVPIASGVLDYFPDAIAAIAELSRIGNDQHNPGQPLHWDRSKSTDHDDCLVRHFMERGRLDTDRVRHRTKVAWRALASLQVEIESERVREGFAVVVSDGSQDVRYEYEVICTRHPMHAETMREEYARDDQSTGL